jgi:hypothetical protein
MHHKLQQKNLLLNHSLDLGLVGQQLAQIQPGAFPTQSVGYQQPQAPVSPLSTALGIGTGIASIGNKLGLFGR